MSKRTNRLLKENNKLENQLRNKENRTVLTDITVYLRSANISPYDQETVRRDIGVMLLEGEQRGDTAKDILGEDYRLFCDHVIAEIPKLSQSRYFLSLIRDVLLSSDVLLTIWFLSNLIEQAIHRNTSPYFTVTFGTLICAMLCISGAFFVFYVLTKYTFSIHGTPKRGESFRLFLLIFFLLLICMCSNIFLQYPLFQIHALIVIIGIVAIFSLYKILDSKLD